MILPGCSKLFCKEPKVVTVYVDRVVRERVPPELYGTCGESGVRALAKGTAEVADAVEQSVERRSAYKQCVDAMEAIRKWDSPVK